MNDAPLQKERLIITNVTKEGMAFGINEETGQTVFFPKQLCSAHNVTEEDVTREVESFVREGHKGPEAATMSFLEEDGIADQSQIDELWDAIRMLTLQIKGLKK